MEVGRRLYRERIVPAAFWLAALVGGFLEEAIFRLGLAFYVLRGGTPQPLERRWWNRGAEVPSLVDVYDWTTARLLFSFLVWPPLESDLATAERDHRYRVEEVLEAIAKGAAEKMWSTYWEASELKWDYQREVWVDAAGHAYDGARLYEYSRGGGG
jgi:hypothetical protein